MTVRFRPTVADVDLEAVRHNVRALKPSGADLMAVVKSDSEAILGVNGLLFGLVIILAGFVVYGLTRGFRGDAKPTGVADVEVTETA